MSMIRFAVLLAILFVWASCANIAPITGGEADKVAPNIVVQNIKDSVLNFKGGVLKIDFDEWITVQANAIETFPLTKSKPKVVAKKKSLYIYLPDSLLESETTYKISLNNAIKDVHEQNPLEKYSFNFSTGSYFDSLKIKGKVVNAKTGLPDTAAFVMLYNAATFADSDILIKKPLYVQKVDAGGNYNISFLKNTDFKIFALRDLNKNYLYEPYNEGMGFIATTINPLKASDSIIYSFDAASADSISKQAKRPESFKHYWVNIDSTQKATFDFTQSIQIKFKNKIESFDAAKILLYQDSTLDASGIVSLDSSKTKIIINSELEPGAHYKLILKQGFASDSAAVAAEYNFTVKKKKDYGTLQILLEKELLQPKAVLQLYSAGKLIAKQYVVSDSVYNFQLLLPGNYQARLLYDKNDNGEWDSGNYFKKLQPELNLAYPSEIVIKAAWDNQIKWREQKRSR